MDDVGLRCGDDERHAVIERLAEHYRAGRLTADELDERSSLAQTSVTRGDLMMLERDLPDLAPAAPAGAPAPVPAGRPRREHRPQRHAVHHWHTRDAVTTYVVVMGLLWCIWAFTGADYPWPIWPMLGWGAPLLLSTLKRRDDRRRDGDRAPHLQRRT